MLYFAYGSNMNEDELIDKDVTILRTEKVLLKDYKIALTRNSDTRKGGVLDIIPENGEVAEGVLFNIPDTDITKINKKEGVCVGAYEPVIIKVEDYDGKITSGVITYQVCNKIDAKPASQEYKDSVLRGACEHGLSQGYRAKLKAVLEKREV